ncbi:MAG: hypothetical protein QW680_12515 [Pyrobaculum sp.]
MRIVWLERRVRGGEVPPWLALKLPAKSLLIDRLTQYALDNEVPCALDGGRVAWLYRFDAGMYRPICYEVPARISVPKWESRLVSRISRETGAVNRDRDGVEFWNSRIVVLDTKKFRIWQLEPLLGPLLSYLYGVAPSHVRTIIESAARGSLKAILTWENKYGSSYRERVKYFRAETKKARSAFEKVLEGWPKYVQIYYNKELGVYKIEGRGDQYHNHLLVALDILITAFGWTEEPPRDNNKKIEQFFEQRRDS